MAASMCLRPGRRLFLNNYRYFSNLQGRLTFSTHQQDGESSGTSEQIHSVTDRLVADEKTRNEVPEFLEFHDDKDVAKDKVDKPSAKLKDEPPMTFATMLRKSPLMQIGDFKGARLIGHIIEVQDDDLYIDFGGKFFCVCPRPKPKSEYYKGRTVDIILQEWEMSSKFIGSERHTTLMEADATLIGLSKLRAPANQKKTSLDEDKKVPVELINSVV